MDRDGRRAEYAAGLRAEAQRRFGAARAEALSQAIDNTAGFMAEVATFQVDLDEHPAFYVEPGS
jgi:hypothetical protein